MDRQASSATRDAAMAKRYATEACCQVADDAVQVCILLITSCLWNSKDS